MSKFEPIEAEILSLPSSEFEQFKLWLLILDCESRGKQIEQDIENGEFEVFA